MNRDVQNNFNVEPFKANLIMKKIEVFFKDTNFVGSRELENVKDVVKVMEAGIDMANRDGLGFLSDVEVKTEDEDGIHTDWREPTEQEVFDRIQEELNDEDGHVYAGAYMDASKYSIEPFSQTVLHSDFYVGQKVYVMHNNKIKEVYVSNIMLADKNGIDTKYHKNYMVNLPNPEKYTNYGNETVRFDTKHTPNVIFLATNENGYSSDTYFDFGVYPETEVFATKDKLVDHLMGE